MCAISGFLHLGLKPMEAHTLRCMGETLHHRGPDHFGYFHDGFVGLANNRLSLLDLSENGNQPFENDDFVLVYNGEIYNFAELKKELEPFGAAFRSSTDTEVLFQHLVRFGAGRTLPKLEGMFAFAFYDKKQRELLLVRDRIGIKPLFYAVKDQVVYFASELKAILKRVRLTLNPIKVLYSAEGILEKARVDTAFDELKHVEPGTYVVFAPGKRMRVERYFTLEDLVDRTYFEHLDRISTSEVLGEMEDLVRGAIARISVCDAPLGAFVSGGIDSGLIASFATDTRPDLALFTANVVGKYSEFEDATALAEVVRRPLFAHQFEPNAMLRGWVTASYYYESPLVTHVNAIPFANVAGLAREKSYKAVLTGEGADELFLGYPRLLARRYDSFLRFPYTILDRLYGLHSGLDDYVSKTRSTGLLESFELLSQRYERQILREGAMGKYCFLPEKRRHEQYLTIQMLNEGIVSLLWRNDRMGMQHSIESRFPYLDEPLIRFAVNLPVKHKIRHTFRFHDFKHPFAVDKFIVRKLAKKRLPPRLTRKAKLGFPMYGLSHVRVDNRYFRDGFWQDLLKLTQPELEYMVAHTHPYMVAKFVSVDIWGRLFVFQEPIPAIDERLSRDVRLVE